MAGTAILFCDGSGGVMVYLLINETKVGGKATIDIDLLKGDDKQRIEVEDSTPDGGLYFGHGRATVSGRRVKTEHVPKAMKALNKGRIPDYGCVYGLQYVSDRFKAVVETLEPGVHQFLPFQILGPKKAVLADMWLMVVCNRIDSVDREHTTLLLYNGGMWLPGREVPCEQWPPNFDPNVAGKFVFNIDQISAHHLWYDKHSMWGPYITSALAEAILAANLTGIKLVKQEAV